MLQGINACIAYDQRKAAFAARRSRLKLEAIDIYDHIDLKELKEAYMACIPQLGI